MLCPACSRAVSASQIKVQEAEAGGSWMEDSLGYVASSRPMWVTLVVVCLKVKWKYLRRKQYTCKRKICKFIGFLVLILKQSVLRNCVRGVQGTHTGRQIFKSQVLGDKETDQCVNCLHEDLNLDPEYPCKCHMLASSLPETASFMSKKDSVSKNKAEKQMRRQTDVNFWHLFMPTRFSTPVHTCAHMHIKYIHA